MFLSYISARNRGTSQFAQVFTVHGKKTSARLATNYVDLMLQLERCLKTVIKKDGSLAWNPRCRDLQQTVSFALVPFSMVCRTIQCSECVMNELSLVCCQEKQYQHESRETTQKRLTVLSRCWVFAFSKSIWTPNKKTSCCTSKHIRLQKLESFKCFYELGKDTLHGVRGSNFSKSFPISYCSAAATGSPSIVFLDDYWSLNNGPGQLKRKASHLSTKLNWSVCSLHGSSVDGKLIVPYPHTLIFHSELFLWSRSNNIIYCSQQVHSLQNQI